MELQHLELTEKDFQMIIQGLDCLPDRGAVGEFMMDMIVGILPTRNETEEMKKERLIREREEKERKKEKEKEILKEDIRILQGKLLQLKRFLQQEGAIKGAYDIINHIK